MSLTDDCAKVAQSAMALLSLDGAALDREYHYNSLSLCVIDAVFSIGVRYEGVRAVGRRYCEYFGLDQYRPHQSAVPAKASQEALSGLVQHFDDLGLERMTSDVFANRQRTSSKSGILKAEAVWKFANALRSHRIEYLQDVDEGLPSEALQRAIGRIPGQGSGISLQYCWMLAGSDELIKPDRMVLRLLKDSLGRPVSTEEALRLVAGAVAELKAQFPAMTPQLLDHKTCDSSLLPSEGRVVVTHQMYRGGEQEGAMSETNAVGIDIDTLVTKLCSRVDTTLYASDGVSRRGAVPDGSHLIFPVKRGARRVSEQEVRFLFAHALEAIDAPGEALFYAVEVPTEKKYCFSGEGERSASTDLALYGTGDLVHPCLNVEFKAKGRSANRLVDTVVRKDIAKLLAEPCDGLWYHLLKSANSATLRSLVELFNDALADLVDGGLARYTRAPLQPKRLHFHVCVLERQLALHCAMSVAPDGSGAALTVPISSVRQGALVIDEAGAWHVRRAAAPAAVAGAR
jgi:hypothetical protein